MTDTDLVERLTHHATRYAAYQAGDLMQEAAAEINRLNGELDEMTPSYHRWQRELQECIEEERERCAKILDAASFRQRFGDGNSTALSIFADRQAAAIRGTR